MENSDINRRRAQTADLKTHAAECESIQRPSAFVGECLRQKKADEKP